MRPFPRFAVKSKLNFSSINNQWPKKKNRQQRKLHSYVKGEVNYEVKEMTEASSKEKNLLTAHTPTLEKCPVGFWWQTHLV